MQSWRTVKSQIISVAMQIKSKQEVLNEKSSVLQAAEIIEEFQHSKEVAIVPLTPALFKEGLDLYRRLQDISWGLVDCISFVVMQESGADTALTFDQHFVQAGFKALMRDPL